MADPITGIGGDVSLGGSAVAHVRKFSLNRKANIAKYASSDTAGYEKSADGIKEWDASIDIYSDGGNAAVGSLAVGAKVAVVLTSVAGKTFTGNCRIDGIDNLEADIEGSGMVAMTLNVTGHGTYTDV